MKPTNSLVTKYNAKNKPNLTSNERKTQPKIELSAESRMPNMVTLRGQNDEQSQDRPGKCHGRLDGGFVVVDQRAVGIHDMGAI